MRNAVFLPSGKNNDAGLQHELMRFTDHLVARLRDVQALLADRKPDDKAEKKTGS